MLVGRQAEQQAIDRLAAAARLATSGVLVVAGEAGVGKTALLEYAVGTFTEMRMLRATGLESEREIPFATLHQLLRPALGVLDEIPQPQADALAAALALPGEADRAEASGRARPDARDRFVIGAAVLNLVCRYAEDGPVAIVVDDAHLADTASVDALRFAARRLAADPVVVLLGARSPEGDHISTGLASMTLQGLDLESTRTLLARRHGSLATDEQVQELHRATGGNPLALLELDPGDHEVIESIEAELPLRVPQALAEAFGRRLAHLDDECRTVLLVAAVCSGDLRQITTVCDALNASAARLGDAEDAGLVRVAGGRVEFRHPLVRAAAYSRASSESRRAAHRAAADAIAVIDPDRRAWHLAEATWHPDSDIAALLAQAGEHALSRAAYSIASGAFERSSRLTPDAAERGVLLLQAADAAWTSGDGHRALMLLDEHTREADSGPDTVPDTKALELRAAIAARTGSLREALNTLLIAAEASDSPDELAVILADAVHACFYLGDAGTASALADRLAAVSPRLITARARALALMASGMARTLAGRGGADDFRAAVPLLEADPLLRHDPRRLSWLLLAPLFLRDATGGAQLRRLVDEVRGAAGVGALPAVLFHVARDQAARAEWARAEANYVESIRFATETGQTTELAMSLAGLSWLESHAGRSDASRAHAAEARALCATRDIHIGEAWVDFALGDLELSLGHADEAVAHLSALDALLERLGLDDADLSPAPELTDALLRLGRRSEAEAVAAHHRTRAADKGQPWARARADRACALVAADDSFEAWFRSALEWHAQTLDDFEEARTHLAFGEKLRRAHRRVDARVELRAALTEFTDLGAVVWRGVAAAELTATGERVPAIGASPVTGLTAQELQVCLLLADGSTTREAAAALFLSPKTVEYHLRKVYTKLGISSRAELATAIAGGIPPQAATSVPQSPRR